MRQFKVRLLCGGKRLYSNAKTTDHGCVFPENASALANINADPMTGSGEGFDAYGNPSNPSISTPFQYQGAWGSYTGSETGLVLQGHRYYDPVTGRWLTRDPIGYAGRINVNGDVGEDPVNWADPSGLSTYTVYSAKSSVTSCASWQISSRLRVHLMSDNVLDTT